MMTCDLLRYSAFFAASLVFAPLLPGIINRVKAFFAGRRGPSLFQLYYDLAKLVRKESIVSTTSGGVVVLMPYLVLAPLPIAGMLLPCGGKLSPFGFTGDVILFFYLLGISRMALIFGALDTGSSFEGMGASREAHFSALAEAAVFGIIAFLVMLSGSCETGMLIHTGLSGNRHATSLLLAAAAFFVVLLTENCRVPADDPETHLELTMIHEAMVLDCAGPELAAILYAGALKLWLFASFFVMLLMPAGPWSLSAYIPVFCGGMIVTAGAVGCVESCMARYRFLKVPQMLTGALCVALLAIFFLVFFEGIAR